MSRRLLRHGICDHRIQRAVRIGCKRKSDGPQSKNSVNSVTQLYTFLGPSQGRPGIRIFGVSGRIPYFPAFPRLAHPFAGFARLFAVARFCPGCCGFPLLPRSFCGLPAFFTRSLRGPLSVARSSRNLLPVACGAWRSPLPGGRITARHLHPRRQLSQRPAPASARSRRPGAYSLQPPRLPPLLRPPRRRALRFSQILP